ncbi:MAG: hypothetical protein Q9159_002725 [Coniocarpon cinnabarinum]
MYDERFAKVLAENKEHDLYSVRTQLPLLERIARIERTSREWEAPTKLLARGRDCMERDTAQLASNVLAVGSGDVIALMFLRSTSTSAAGSAVPWRRANVKHTSNELYVDIVESLSVVLAPSGRPISAFANGTVAFTAKISGVPDLLLTLSAPGGRRGVEKAMDLAVFHPCVRLARWRERPGELSFVPPDGRFALAGYECDLIPGIFDAASTNGKIPVPNVNLPVTAELVPSLGKAGDELEVRLILPLRVAAGSSSFIPSHESAAVRSLSNVGRPGSGSGNVQTAAGGPTPENIIVSIPAPQTVRNITNIRTSKGEAHFLPEDFELEWRVSGREAATIGSAGATLRCTLVGMADQNADHDPSASKMKLKTDTFDYDEGLNGSYQDDRFDSTKDKDIQDSTGGEDSDLKSKNAALMPQSVQLSFYVKGWLASGLKVDALAVNTKSSKGLGAGVTPYKGVKYHTISQKGVEVRT